MSYLENQYIKHAIEKGYTATKSGEIYSHQHRLLQPIPINAQRVHVFKLYHPEQQRLVSIRMASFVYAFFSSDQSIPVGHQVKHKDGNNLNFALDNLELVELGSGRLASARSRKPSKAYSRETISQIRERYVKGETMRSIHKDYEGDMTYATLCNIATSRTYRHVASEEDHKQG